MSTDYYFGKYTGTAWIDESGLGDGWLKVYVDNVSGGGSWVGTKQLGTTADDRGEGVAVDRSGNVYVAGTTFGDLEGSSSAPNGNMFLVKYDAAGTKQWTRQLGTTEGDQGSGIAVDTSGNVYVTGTTYGGLDGNTNAGGADMFLVKYDAAGTKQWTQQMGSTASDTGYSVAVDDNGNIYVTGQTQGNLDGNTNAGSYDIFLVKYNAAGAKQWTQQLGTASYDDAAGVAVDRSGNIYVSGATEGGFDGYSNLGQFDSILVKFNDAGTQLWLRQLGTTANDFSYKVAVDGSGNAYVTGYTQGNLDVNINAGNYDMFLTKYDDAGTKQWTKLLGTTADDTGYGVAVDGSGNVYVTGSTGGGLDGNTSAGNDDIFLVKYNDTGTKQWTQQLGTTTDDVGAGVAVDGTGNIYITGYTYGGLDGNTSAGSWDMFLVKYDAHGVIQ